MEMKVGDYARTKKGDIGKIDYITETIISIKIEKDISLCTPKENVLISSKDLFDVLFAGDYINGKEGGRIKAKVTDQKGKYFLVGHTGLFFPEYISEIVTAEKKKILEQMKKDLREKNKELKKLRQKVKDFEKEATYIL